MFMGDSTKVTVDFLGMIKLELTIGNFLELQNVAFIPNIKRNLIYLSILDSLGYNLQFGYGKVILYRGSFLVGNGILSGNLYRLELFDNSNFANFFSSLNVANSSKHFGLPRRQGARFGFRFVYFEARTVTKMKVGVFKKQDF